MRSRVTFKYQAEGQEIAFDGIVRFAKGDLDGYAVWKRVLKAVGELVRSEPIERERVN